MNTKRNLCYLIPLCALALGIFSGVFNKNDKIQIANADSNSARVVFDEDFSSGGGVLSDFVRVENQEAIWTASSPSYFFMSSPLESNNYEVSFDMKWLSNPGDVYFDMVGLDGSKHNNVFMHIINEGELLAPYWAIQESGGASIFNNSGLDQGGLNDSAINMSNYVNIKYIHFFLKLIHIKVTFDPFQ